MPTTPTPATLYAALADALSGLAVAREELTAAYNDPAREEHYHLTMLAAKRLQTAPHGATLTH